MFRLIIIPCLIALSFLSFSLKAEAARVVSQTGTEIGRYAPPIELTDLTGNTVSLESLRGSVLLLTFWSTHCSPCMAKMPSLNRLHDSLKDKEFEVISVAIDETDLPVREYVTKNNIGFTVLLGMSRDVFFDRYAAPGLPATYLIDRSGIIVEKFNGLAVWDAPDMKNRILMLLQMR